MSPQENVNFRGLFLVLEVVVVVVAPNISSEQCDT